MSDDFDTDKYFEHKARWESYFGALVAVGDDPAKSQEERDAFVNALCDAAEEMG